MKRPLHELNHTEACMHRAARSGHVLPCIDGCQDARRYRRYYDMDKRLAIALLIITWATGVLVGSLVS